MDQGIQRVLIVHGNLLAVQVSIVTYIEIINDHCLSSHTNYHLDITYISSHRIWHIKITYWHMIIYCHFIIVYCCNEIGTCLLLHDETFRATVQKGQILTHQQLLYYQLNTTR